VNVTVNILFLAATDRVKINVSSSVLSLIVTV